MLCVIQRLHCTKCLLQTSYVRQYATQTAAALPIIKVPHRLQLRLQKEREKADGKRHQMKRHYKGPLMISCKRKEFNHYKGQTYSDFNPRMLASGGWKHSKSKGDCFTINATQGNPSLEVQDNATFEDFGFHSELVNGLKEYGITKPTYIQALTIPEMLASKNVLCAAETGSGKTLAFLLPIIENIHKYIEQYGPTTDDTPNQPYAVIMAPSRELVDQMLEVAKDLSKHTPFQAVSYCGGRGTQNILKFRTKRAIDLFITTPGIFKRLLVSRIFNMARLTHVVIDEADTLLDDSFSGLTLDIIRKLKITSEKALFGEGEEAEYENVGTSISFVGATMPRDLENILGDIVPYDTIEQVTTPFLHRLMPHVPQKFMRVGIDDKLEAIMKLVNRNMKKKVPTIIFCNKTSTACYLHHRLDEMSFPSVLLHGKIPETERRGRFDEFQREKYNIMVCTDIASRGLDTTRARQVINYDFPQFMSDYIHRVGRVGRVGGEAACMAISFVTYKWDIDLLWKIEASARKVKELHNVNANIKRKLNSIILQKFGDQTPDYDPNVEEQEE